MGTFDDLEAALGIDSSDPDDALARDLVQADDDLLEQLVYIRKMLTGMTGVEVADRMGRHRSVVTNFEKLTADPHLSTIRRYAHAIGARITHKVEWVLPRKADAPGQPESAGHFARFDVYDSGPNPTRSWPARQDRGTAGDVRSSLVIAAHAVAGSEPSGRGGRRRPVEVSGSAILISDGGGTGR